jgi:hypothetical protein
MDKHEKDESPNEKKVPDLEKESKRQKLWGAFYMILGMAGLAASLYSGYYDLYNIVPLFGTVMAGLLTCAISILIILYGYRMMRNDL